MNIQTFMSRNKKMQKVYLLNRRQVEKIKGEKGQKSKRKAQNGDKVRQ